MTEPFIYKTIARFSDTDLYGVVHHSNYLRWMEEARMQLLEEVLKMSIEECNMKNIQFPVIHLTGKYIRSIRARQSVVVKMLLHYDESAKFVFTYDILNEEDKMAFKGKTEHALTQEGKILYSMPELLSDNIQKIMLTYKGRYVVTT